MTFVPMFDVMPITGTWRNERRFCAICALGGAPAMFALLSPEAMREQGALENIQRISDEQLELQVLIVCTGAPTKALKTAMRKMAAARQIRVPLAPLPTGELPALPGISPKAEKAVLLYRGQEVTAKYEDVDFSTFLPCAVAAGASLESAARQRTAADVREVAAAMLEFLRTDSRSEAKH